MTSAPSPISVTKTLTTVARIGWSMKVWVKRIVAPSLMGTDGRRDAAVHGCDFGPRPGAHQAVDDDVIVRRQPALNDAQSLVDVAGPHRLRHHSAVGRH